MAVVTLNGPQARLLRFFAGQTGVPARVYVATCAALRERGLVVYDPGARAYRLSDLGSIVVARLTPETED